ncbi:hypothetical protein OG496_51745 [Streptomyces sp. NBC_00988]|uniref:hypothetical protein n=1 Tax=Streptomyces sp. NBC_00988 TaxID=2903704 RepID=UPI00386ED2C4|nr:hypothetical protein OG496_51745 [Streptomyces sp. NBC_00988]
MPPSRLLLGRVAYDIATAPAKLDSLRPAFDSWREVTVGADFPPRDAVVPGAC